MKINMLLSGCLLGLLCFTACDSEGNEMNDYTHYVNPFIGTGGHGHTHPGAMVPHGMIQPGPDTRIDGWDSCSGYYYEDTTINGFAHTRLSGTGCADFGDFLLMPTVGVQRTDFLGTESQKRPFASAFLMKGICRTGILFCFSGYIRGKSRTDFDRACGNASVYFSGK